MEIPCGALPFSGCSLLVSDVTMEAVRPKPAVILFFYENNPYCNFTGVRFLRRSLFPLGQTGDRPDYPQPKSEVRFRTPPAGDGQGRGRKKESAGAGISRTQRRAALDTGLSPAFLRRACTTARPRALSWKRA